MSEENKDMGSSFEIGSLEQRLRQAVDEIDNIKLSFTKNTEELSRIKTMLDVEALKEITSKIGSGSTPRGGESAYKESGISLIRSQNIYDEGMREKGLVFIDEEQAKKLNNVSVEKNDI